MEGKYEIIAPDNERPEGLRNVKEVLVTRTYIDGSGSKIAYVRPVDRSREEPILAEWLIPSFVQSVKDAP